MSTDQRRRPDPCLTVGQWALAKEPNCGQPQPWPRLRQQDEPDSAEDGGQRARLPTNTALAELSVNKLCQ